MRIRKCFADVASKRELCLDSLIITASCSPEGRLLSNRMLSLDRSEMVRKYITDYIPEDWKKSIKVSALPENWIQLERLVVSDTVMSIESKERILGFMNQMDDLDERESAFASLPEYRYLREKLYPKLRSVRFDFYMHRLGVQKDTIHSTELDTLYMSGLDAMKNLDYKRAVKILKPYRDYNAALALMSADYNHTAMDVLEGLEEDARVCYLKAIILARMGAIDEAAKYLDLSIAYDAHMGHRANLDPELYELVKQRNINLN